MCVKKFMFTRVGSTANVSYKFLGGIVLLFILMKMLMV